VYDAVALGRLPFGGTGDDQLILDAIAQTDLEHLMLREVTRLSAGEAQRVLLATVLAQDPPMLLLDEPSSALDPRQTARVFSLLRYLAASGKTVVAAVHDVNLAVAYADAFLALRKPAEKAGKNANGANKVDEDEGFPWTASAEELDEKVLERIYDAPFDSYISHRGAKVWHVRVN
jgi:iron complex transport system ATP-binding protein